MPLPVQNPRLVQLIRDGFSVVGRTRFMVDEVIAPVAIVGDLREPAVERRYGIGEQTTAPVGATDFVVHQMHNPAGSGVLVRVTQIYWSLQAGSSTVTLRLDQVQGATLVGNPSAFDRRSGGLSQAEFRSDINFALGIPIIMQARDVGSRSNRWVGDVLLAEGSNLTLGAFLTDNDRLMSGWQITEFPAGETRLG